MLRARERGRQKDEAPSGLSLPVGCAIVRASLTDVPEDTSPLQHIEVRVKPGAHTSALTQAADGTWVAQVRAAPVDGKANEELIALVAAHFGCRKADVVIRSGASGRRKLVRIDP